VGPHVNLLTAPFLENFRGATIQGFSSTVALHRDSHERIQHGHIAEFLNFGPGECERHKSAVMMGEGFRAREKLNFSSQKVPARRN
jgi:hypothetical protein